MAAIVVCAAPDCVNTATSTGLCPICEGRWMRDRSDVVDEAEHLTDLAAQFAAYCRDRGLPDPFKD